MDGDIIKLILELSIAIITFLAGFVGGTFYTKKKYNINRQKNNNTSIGNNNFIKQENKHNEKSK
mgnify:CR=1 FL=1